MNYEHCYSEETVDLLLKLINRMTEENPEIKNIPEIDTDFILFELGIILKEDAEVPLCSFNVLGDK